MSVVILYCLCFLINAYLAYKNQLNKWFLILSIIFIFIFMLGNYTAPDYLSYLNDYSLISAGKSSNFSDIGYVFLENFFCNLNFNYSVFRAFILVTSYILIFYFLKNLKINTHFIVSLFLVYQCFMDTMQIRNFLAYSIFLFATRYILNESSRNDKLKYAFLVIIAGSIHSSLFIYLIFLLKDFFLSHRKVYKVLMIGSILCSITIFVFPNVTKIFHYILGLMNREDIAIRYFEHAGESFGFILPVLSFIILMVMLCFFSKKSFLKEKDSKFTTNVINFNLISMLFLPLVIIDPTWYRVNRNLNILNYVCVWPLFISINNKRDKVLLFLSIYILAFLWFFIECINWIGIQKIFSMFCNNGFYI